MVNKNEKARSGTLSLEEMSGGTFTITNGGVFGSLVSTPILNEPQSATQALTPPEYVTHMLCRNEQYARSHGYSYELEARRQLPNTFAPSWERLPAMLRLLARERVPRQIIMYLDTDVQVGPPSHVP